jgi:hypothetical protein
LAVLAALMLFAGKAHAQRQVDVELVLAVDASSSVTDSEFNLQMVGLAEAFRNAEVLGAIEAAGDLGIAVSLVQWAGARDQVISIDFMWVGGAVEAERFAREIEATPRFVIGGGTAIGSAIDFCAALLRNNAFQGRRSVMDISGDGRANQGALPTRRRDAALAQGFIINGLVILNEDPSVDRYYLDNVIGGTGAFILTADDFKDFAEAIVKKLVREISGVPIAAGPHSGRELASVERWGSAAQESDDNY